MSQGRVVTDREKPNHSETNPF